MCMRVCIYICVCVSIVNESYRYITNYIYIYIYIYICKERDRENAIYICLSNYPLCYHSKLLFKLLPCNLFFHQQTNMYISLILKYIYIYIYRPRERVCVYAF